MLNKLSGNRVFSLHPKLIILLLAFVLGGISLAIAGNALLNNQNKLTMLSNQVKQADEVPAFAYLSSTNEPQTAQALSQLTVEDIVDFPKSDRPQISESNDSEWKTVRMRVTAYCPCRKCCGKNSDGYTACMHKIGWGDRFVAADKRIPFGTVMIIPGYNHGKPVKVMDRGRVINGNRLDVFYNTHYTASRWGTKYIDVKIKVK